MKKNNNQFYARDDSDLSKRTIKGGFWVLSIRIAEQVLYLIKLVIFANILEPKDFGLFGVALLTFDIMKIFTRTGFETALIQKKEDIKPYLNSAWTVLILRALGLYAIMFFIAPVAAFYFKAPEATPLIQVIGLAMVFGGFTNIGFFYFDKELKFSKRFIYQLTGMLVDFILAVYTAFVWRNIWAIVISLLAGHATKCIMSYILHPYRPRLSADFKKAKELWTFGKWILLSALIGFLIIEADDIFVAIIIDVTMLGFYQMAYKISNLPATEITNVISQVTFPAYSKLQDDRAKLREGYLKILKNVAYLTFLAGGLIFTFAFDFIKIFLGQKWVPMVLTLQVLALWGIIRSLEGTAVPIFQGVGKPETLTKLQLIQFILMAIILYPLTIQYNIFGTSVAVVSAAFLANFIYFYKVNKIIKGSKSDLCKLIGFPLINTAIMIIAVYFVKIYFNLTVGLLELCILGAFALLIYFGLTLLYEKIFNYKIIGEGLNLVKQFVGLKTAME
ncbi:MAG: lipopolysaccharide biosynthesis protein [Candidatus Helarchaeota archaeon]